MHKNWNSIARILCGAIIAVMAASSHASAQQDGGSVLRVSGRGEQTKSVMLGAGKSMLVEFDIELRDVLVSDPRSVDAVVQSSNRVFLIAKAPGQTNAFFFDADGQQILTLNISVGADVQGLEALLNRLISGANIRAEMAGKSIVLSGTVRSPVDATRASDLAKAYVASQQGALVGSSSTTNQTNVSASGGSSQTTTQTGDQDSASTSEDNKPVINMIAVEAEEQVMLRVVVAEVQRTLLKQFGINIGAAINSGNFSTAILTDNALPLTAGAGLGALPLATATGAFNPAVSWGNIANSGVTTGWTNGTSQVSQTLRALERDGLLRTLAEPNLTAISGESAKFLAGGEFPVLEPSGFGQTTVQYKPYGIGISFTPVVLSEGRISLKIESEVSELTNTGAIQVNNISIPALKTRKANSTVELPSGGALALAGLISDSTRQNIDGFPGLKDLPVLGTLFRSRDFIKEETELVVIVTPYLVKPVAQKDLAKPLDGLAESTDRKANFMGHLNRIYGTESVAPAGDLKGDYGFIVE